MTDVVVAHTDLGASEDAGIELGKIVYEQLGGQVPDALLVFASPNHDYSLLLQAIKSHCHPRTLVGCSLPELVNNAETQPNSVRVMALRSDDMDFRVELARGLRNDDHRSAHCAMSALAGKERWDYAYRSAMVLTDAPAALADSLVQELNLKTAGHYQLMGSGAGDGGGLPPTHVFYGTEVVTDAVVVLEILSNRPINIGLSAQHGWEPASETMRVTEVDGTRLVSLDAVRVLEIFEAHAAETGQQFDWENPQTFFLSNAIGIEAGGAYLLRVPWVLNDDGSITFAAEIPLGSSVRIMRANGAGDFETAATASTTAQESSDDTHPDASIFFDCVANRLRNGRNFDQELQALQDSLAPWSYAGCNTYGQMGGSEGRHAFHSCTAVTGVIP